jgi:hypothetical protein
MVFEGIEDSNRAKMQRKSRKRREEGWDDVGCTEDAWVKIHRWIVFSSSQKQCGHLLDETAGSD